jgi:glycosyltransferase involved in cell wall biosynthesis
MVFETEASMLESEGHEVLRCTISNSEIRNTNSLRVATETFWSQSSYARIRNIVETFQPAVVHFHNTFPLISPAGYYAAKTSGAAVVQTLHNYRLLCPSGTLFRDGRVCMDCMNASLPWPSVAHRCYRASRSTTAVVAGMLTLHRILRTWSRMVDLFIALTSRARDWFTTVVSEQKIVVKPNTVSSDPGPGCGKGGYALFVGRLVEEKGVKTLVEAWKRLAHPIPLKIAGSGPLQRFVTDACAQLRDIEFVGWRTKEEIGRLMSRAEFLVAPSIWEEPFGAITVEALSHGTPVIASEIGSFAEIITTGRNGLLFRPGDADHLAETVRWALANPIHMAEMRLNARSDFESKYTPRQNYRELLSIYESAVALSKGKKARLRNSYQ